MTHIEENATWVRDWGTLLRTARQVAGISLTELSKRSGLSKGYLSKLESGHVNARNPSRATLAALARALPGFGALAHVLEPGEAAPEVSVAASDMSLVPVELPQAWGETEHLQLDWRELEALVAVLVIERAAVPVPCSAALIARVIAQPVDATREILARLVLVGLLSTTAPAAPGRPPGYACSQPFLNGTGIVRVGDVLLLAAAMLARASRSSNSHSDTPVAVEEPAGDPSE